MNKEHLDEALQAYFSRFGYVERDGEYFEVENFNLEPNDVVYIKGKVVPN